MITNWTEHKVYATTDVFLLTNIFTWVFVADISFM